MDRITELRIAIQNRKEHLRKKRVQESIIANDSQLTEWADELKTLDNNPISSFLETALKDFITENKGSENLDKILKKHLIDTALVMTYGNQSKAARMLGINRGTINNVLGK